MTVPTRPAGSAEIRVAAAAMGTRFEIVLLGENRGYLRAAGEAALARVEEAHQAFSRFDQASLLAHLRRSAPRPVVVDRETLAMFENLACVARQSDRTFDPYYLSPAGMTEWPIIDRHHSTVAFPTSACDPDLGGCAKGFAVDWAVTVLRGAGVEQAFVQGGTSSMFGLGSPSGSPGWRVALGPQADDPVIALLNQGLACSASMTMREGQRIPHLFDRGTGRVLMNDHRAVVVGPSAGPADAWATAAAVTGTRPRLLEGQWNCWIRKGAQPWQVPMMTE